MVKLEFNGDPIECREGETLLEAARRNAAHVWFLCDGRGICQTCECRVTSGAEHLGDISDLERLGLREQRRRRGYRLACQARLVGSGPVSVVSRAEELRRRARAVLSSSNAQDLGQRLGDLGGEALSATVDLLTGVTVVSPRAIPQLLKMPPTPSGILKYARDAIRLAGRLLTGAGGPDGNSHPQTR